MAFSPNSEWWSVCLQVRDRRLTHVKPSTCPVWDCQTTLIRGDKMDFPVTVNLICDIKSNLSVWCQKKPVDVDMKWILETIEGCIALTKTLKYYQLLTVKCSNTFWSRFVNPKSQSVFIALSNIEMNDVQKEKDNIHLTSWQAHWVDNCIYQSRT